MIYGYSDVHRLALDRRLEYWNESSIMLCVYHCFLFTDFVDDPIARYQIGYSFIATVLLNLAVNIIIMLLAIIEKICFTLKTLRKRYRIF